MFSRRETNQWVSELDRNMSEGGSVGDCEGGRGIVAVVSKTLCEEDFTWI